MNSYTIWAYAFLFYIYISYINIYMCTDIEHCLLLRFKVLAGWPAAVFIIICFKKMLFYCLLITHICDICHLLL